MPQEPYQLPSSRCELWMYLIASWIVRLRNVERWEKKREHAREPLLNLLSLL